MRSRLFPFDIASYLCIILVLVGCNKDATITEDVTSVPSIELDSETGIYTIKVGRELTIAPTYYNVENALYAWTIDGKLYSTEPTFTYAWDEAQELYVKLRVDVQNAYAEEEMKVEVLELTPPTISLSLPSKGLKVMKSTDYLFAPAFGNDDLEEFEIEWLLDGDVVSTDTIYTFNQSELGTYDMVINASNIDGLTTKAFQVEVVETMPYEVYFPSPSLYTQTSTDRYTFSGRPVYLRPLLEYFDNPTYEWAVDGEVVANETEREYKFTPTSAGEYTNTLTVTENTSASDSKVSATVKVICVDATEASRCREITAASSALWDKVYEYTPAPGQFINETLSGGFTGIETTQEAAIEYATSRLTDQLYVSLGTFGGYIIVGFDHSVKATNNDYDFAIQGNAFKGSSEPGIVWVMQDINGNGLPDDEWYELKGSETGNDETIQDYEVTYYMPDSAGCDVHWSTSEGETGYVDFLGMYHWQDSYYPLWVTETSYTLRGTRLSARNRVSSSTGFWNNEEYDWGYVDNYGSDMTTVNNTDGSGQMNSFKISNAIFLDGTDANLQYIDFVKVQVGVLAKSGWLGEVSTEVFSFVDTSIDN